MRGHTEFSLAMHIVRAYLYLDGLALRADNGRVQGLVVIVLRVCNVVVKLAGQLRPEVVPGTKRGIAILDVVDQYTNRTNVIQRVETTVLALHLSPNAVNMLGPAGYLGFDALFVEFSLQRRLNLVDEALALDTLFIQRFRDAHVSLGIEVTE